MINSACDVITVLPSLAAINKFISAARRYISIVRRAVGIKASFVHEEL